MNVYPESTAIRNVIKHRGFRAKPLPGADIPDLTPISNFADERTPTLHSICGIEKHIHVVGISRAQQKQFSRRFRWRSEDLQGSQAYEFAAVPERKGEELAVSIVLAPREQPIRRLKWHGIW
jgi:hypothetical protein